MGVICQIMRYADNEYSNQFNISFAIVDIKCAQNYNKFEAKGIYNNRMQNAIEEKIIYKQQIKQRKRCMSSGRLAPMVVYAHVS